MKWLFGAYITSGVSWNLPHPHQTQSISQPFSLKRQEVGERLKMLWKTTEEDQEDQVYNYKLWTITAAKKMSMDTG